MVWTRPTNVEYPSVWYRFKGRKPMINGQIPSFRVQDLPPEMFEDAVEFMASDFLHNEPACKSRNLAQDSLAVDVMKNVWRKTVKTKLALVCFREDPSLPGGYDPEIVGMNVTTIACIEEKDEHTKQFQTESEVISHVFGAFMFCCSLVDIFEKYGVNEYLTAFGLSVKKSWTGQGIGAEILKAREPLCKALGIKVTATGFTAIESQISAKNAGFEEIGVVTYDDLKNKHGFQLGYTDSSMTMKLMTRVYS